MAVKTTASIMSSARSIAAAAAIFAKRAANRTPSNITPDKFAKLMKNEDNDGSIERKEPKLPLNRASTKQIVDTRNVDDEESENDSEDDTTNQEEVPGRASEGVGGEKRRTLFLHTQDVSDLSNDESDEEECLSILEMVIELSTSVEASLGVGVCGGNVVVRGILFEGQPELALRDASVVLHVVEEENEGSQRFEETNESVRLKVDPTVQQVSPTRARFALHDVLLTFLEDQRDARNSISDNTNVKHEEGGQRLRQTEENVKDDGPNFREGTGRQEVADDLLQVRENNASRLNTGKERSEVVISEDDRGSFLGDFGTSSHGNSHIGLTQGRRVIDSITSNGYGIFALLHLGDDFKLVFRGSTSEDQVTMTENPVPMSISEGSDFGTSNDDSTRKRTSQLLITEELDSEAVKLLMSIGGIIEGKLVGLEVRESRNSLSTNNSNHASDSLSGIRVITSNHSDLNTSLVAALDDSRDLNARRIHESSETNEGETRVERKRIVVSVELGAQEGDLIGGRDLLANHRQDTFTLAAHLNLKIKEMFSTFGSKLFELSRSSEVVGASSDHVLCSSFHVHDVFLLLKLVDSDSVLVLRVERNLSNDRSLGTGTLNVVNKHTGPLQQGRIRSTSTSNDKTIMGRQMHSRGIEHGTVALIPDLPKIVGQLKESLIRPTVARCSIAIC